MKVLLLTLFILTTTLIGCSEPTTEAEAELVEMKLKLNIKHEMDKFIRTRAMMEELLDRRHDQFDATLKNIKKLEGIVERTKTKSENLIDGMQTRFDNELRSLIEAKDIDKRLNYIVNEFALGAKRSLAEMHDRYMEKFTHYVKEIEEKSAELNEKNRQLDIVKVKHDALLEDK